MSRPSTRTWFAIPWLLAAACSRPAPSDATPVPAMNDPATPPPAATTTATATFAGGCFWCVEAALEALPGVLDVTSGYIGGATNDPSYRAVCSGETGHAEAVQVTFDPARIPYAELADWFFKVHDPTTLNRQGPDEGTQYRSAIFVHDEAQRREAVAAIARAQPRFRDPIVTQVTNAPRFWPAEEAHQDYFRKNPDAGYCRAMIAPKLKKLGLDQPAK